MAIKCGKPLNELKQARFAELRDQGGDITKVITPADFQIGVPPHTLGNLVLPSSGSCINFRAGGCLVMGDDGQLYFESEAAGLAPLLSGTMPASGGGGSGGWTSETGKVYLTTATDKVGIGITNPTSKLDVKVDSSEGSVIGLHVDQDSAASIGILVDSESTSGGAAIHGLGMFPGRFEQDLPDGRGMYITRNLDETGSYPLCVIHDNHTSNTSTTLQVQQDGTGDIMRLYGYTGSLLMMVKGTGEVGIGHVDPDSKLEIDNGSIHIGEWPYGGAPGTPEVGDGGQVYVKQDGKLYYKSWSVAETALGGGALYLFDELATKAHFGEVVSALDWTAISLLVGSIT